MTDEAQTDDGCTEFEFDQTESEPADIWLDETYVNSYGDARAYIDGATYDAKDIIKFDWETTHHDFDESSKRWVVDTDALDELRRRLEDAGFTVDFSSHTREFDGPLFALHDYVEEGDDITVEYQQKNGEGVSEKAGEVIDVTYDAGYEEEPKVVFRRHDDNHFMYVQFDDYGQAGLYTGGSHAPFVGAIEAVTVHTDEDRTEAEGSEPTADARDNDDAATLPWNQGDA